MKESRIIEKHKWEMEKVKNKYLKLHLTKHTWLHSSAEQRIWQSLSSFWMCGMYEQAVGSLLEPADGTTGAVAAFGFCSPDMTPALDVKEYYCQLAESLQVRHTVA